MCCVRLAGNTGRKTTQKIAIWAPGRHRANCRADSSELRHVSTIGKKVVKQHYLLHMSPQYGELRPTSGWDLLASLGHPRKFQRVSRLGSISARHSSSGRQRRWTEGATYIW